MLLKLAVSIPQSYRETSFRSTVVDTCNSRAIEAFNGTSFCNACLELSVHSKPCNYCTVDDTCKQICPYGETSQANNPCTDYEAPTFIVHNCYADFCDNPEANKVQCRRQDKALTTYGIFCSSNVAIKEPQTNFDVPEIIKSLKQFESTVRGEAGYLRKLSAHFSSLLGPYFDTQRASAIVGPKINDFDTQSFSDSIQLDSLYWCNFVDRSSDVGRKFFSSKAFHRSWQYNLKAAVFGAFDGLEFNEQEEKDCMGALQHALCRAFNRPLWHHDDDPSAVDAHKPEFSVLGVPPCNSYCHNVRHQCWEKYSVRKGEFYESRYHDLMDRLRTNLAQLITPNNQAEADEDHPIKQQDLDRLFPDASESELKQRWIRKEGRSDLFWDALMLEPEANWTTIVARNPRAALDNLLSMECFRKPWASVDCCCHTPFFLGTVHLEDDEVTFQALGVRGLLSTRSMLVDELGLRASNTLTIGPFASAQRRDPTLVTDLGKTYSTPKCLSAWMTEATSSSISEACDDVFSSATLPRTRDHWSYLWPFQAGPEDSLIMLLGGHGAGNGVKLQNDESFGFETLLEALRQNNDHHRFRRTLLTSATCFGAGMFLHGDRMSHFPPNFHAITQTSEYNIGVPAMMSARYHYEKKLDVSRMFVDQAPMAVTVDEMCSRWSVLSAAAQGQMGFEDTPQCLNFGNADHLVNMADFGARNTFNKEGGVLRPGWLVAHAADPSEFGNADYQRHLDDNRNGLFNAYGPSLANNVPGKLAFQVAMEELRNKHNAEYAPSVKHRLVKTVGDVVKERKAPYVLARAHNPDNRKNAGALYGDGAFTKLSSKPHKGCSKITTGCDDCVLAGCTYCAGNKYMAKCRWRPLSAACSTPLRECPRPKKAD